MRKNEQLMRPETKLDCGGLFLISGILFLVVWDTVSGRARASQKESPTARAQSPTSCKKSAIQQESTSVGETLPFGRRNLSTRSTKDKLSVGGE